MIVHNVKEVKSKLKDGCIRENKIIFGFELRLKELFLEREVNINEQEIGLHSRFHAITMLGSLLRNVQSGRVDCGNCFLGIETN